MAKPSKISGFPEWLPEQKIAEEKVIATIFLLYPGYRITKGSTDPEPQYGWSQKPSSKGAKNYCKRDSRYTNALRIGERKNLVDGKPSDQAR